MIDTLYKPMSLTELDNLLKEKGVKATIIRVSQELDEHMIGATVYYTIEAVGNFSDNKEPDKFDQAKAALMGIEGDYIG